MKLLIVITGLIYATYADTTEDKQQFFPPKFPKEKNTSNQSSTVAEQINKHLYYMSKAE